VYAEARRAAKGARHADGRPGNVARRDRTETTKVAVAKSAAPRPFVDVGSFIPDFHDDLRWPLTTMSHPSSEPRFGIAAVFAEPGIGWQELCKRGVHKRVTSGRNRDELQYLRAWCSAAAGDIDAACGTLQPLLTSAVLGLAPAVRVDLANLVASVGHHDEAEHLLNAHKIRDPQILDAVAATYVELGADKDAYEINRLAADMDRHASQETQCRRLLKDLVLSNSDASESSIRGLRGFATTHQLRNPTCERIYNAWQCAANPAKDCAGHLRDIGANYSWRDVLAAYHSWPAGAVRVEAWLRIADSLKFSFGAPAAIPMVIAALDAALRADGYCSPAVRDRIVDIQRLWRLRNVAIPEDMVSLDEACK